ncbi:uncharacterized protein LOC111262726 isoform X2 [Varroa jacobsoni]|uniref:Uncharacterized protein n=1 Tax=Varroa destructor TaxID=109461 RepID=A0A7M7JAJ3_VARDE|nr:uncharacterized protein LOC111245285 isoform X1 [Varroa destructor]XP_022649188.1 uncharacterized protein LOC111245285 isoform X1 [Varroa destructor]XP_022649189.1 uncharacterized protein LOC111245285 isoform X1 [Varroa destructor]XP_022649190.1 uncharacterized protein LOC111245285 isoform X1 [Varroa destructor]XP_022692932.1 uncharacterized protein LOC111262726 isoform X2 [Varroa jacobsoni]XP_022692933.1 uncharacterized protein LOC111262726 isoform X2 [Varroa jacobsoni]XP_022692934.1 unch
MLPPRSAQTSSTPCFDRDGIMGVFPCFNKSSHSGFVLLAGDQRLLRLRADMSSTQAKDITLPQGEISSIAAMSARKLVVVCGYDIYLCTKGKPQKIYEGGTMKPLIGCFGKTLYAAINGRRELHCFDKKRKTFVPLCSDFDSSSEKVFSIGNSDSDKHDVLIVVYRPTEAVSRVLEIDRRTGERRDLNCPSDVMALYRAGDRIFATGSVSSRSTKQFFEYNYKEARWLERPERTYGLANQTTDKVLYVPGYFVSFTEKAASSVNTLIEIYDVNSEKWSSQESEFAKIRAVACC